MVEPINYFPEIGMFIHVMLCNISALNVYPLVAVEANTRVIISPPAVSRSEGWKGSF